MEITTMEETMMRTSEVVFYKRDYDIDKCDSAQGDNLDWEHCQLMEEQYLSNLLRDFIQYVSGVKVKKVMFKNTEGISITDVNGQHHFIENAILVSKFRKFLKWYDWDVKKLVIKQTKICYLWEIKLRLADHEINGNQRQLDDDYNICHWGEYLLQAIFMMLWSLKQREDY